MIPLANQMVDEEVLYVEVFQLINKKGVIEHYLFINPLTRVSKERQPSCHQN